MVTISEKDYKKLLKKKEADIRSMCYNKALRKLRDLHKEQFDRIYETELEYAEARSVELENED